ncbi:MAG: SDR family oxidoreductase [Geminicoccaceae bacterium]
MKIVVIGGTGLIGSKLVDRLQAARHEVVAAAPSTGVNTITGEGVMAAVAAAQVVVDVANSPSFEDKSVLEFFETSGRNLLAAEKVAGVGHHVALSVVGSDRSPASGYLCAKLAQERLIETSGIPYTILRATQFFEFIGRIARSSAVSEMVRVSPALLQPIASDDVVAALADIAVGSPINGMVEVAGPEKIPLDDLVGAFLRAFEDGRQVVSDVHARYFGIELNDRSLTADDGARRGTTRFQDWLSRAASQYRAA